MMFHLDGVDDGDQVLARLIDEGVVRLDQVRRVLLDLAEAERA